LQNIDTNNRTPGHQLSVTPSSNYQANACTDKKRVEETRQVGHEHLRAQQGSQLWEMTCQRASIFCYRMPVASEKEVSDLQCRGGNNKRESRIG
jgi:hypothetical protein